MTPSRRLCALLLSLVVALAPATPALAQDNTAVAVNTKDGSSLFKLAFSIKKTLQPVVENGNAAVAYASCTECQTVAIAIQVVLVMGDVDTATPENVAIAINQDCTACETLAAAYQFVLSTGGVVRFTQEGRREITAIHKALQDLGKSDLSIEEIVAALDDLTDRLRVVLRDELEPVGPEGIGGGSNDGSGGEKSAEPEGSAAPESGATPEATGTATPEPTTTPEAAPTASAEPTATATPTAEATP